MTFANILLDAYGRLGFAGTTDATVIARIKRFVNESAQDLAGEPGLASLMLGSVPFASVASQPTYGLPPVISRVFTIRETTSRRKLWPRSLDWYRTVAPDPLSPGGTAAYYVMLGPQAVAKQPSDASELFVKSSAAGDTSQVVHFEVVRSGTGQVQTGSVTLTGTTAVSLGSTITDIIEVRDLYLSAVTVGNVTLLEDSGAGTELARIAIGQQRSRYELIALYPTPSSAITYSVDYELDVTDLVQDADEPYWLPPRFHRMLGIGARMKEYEKTDDDRFDRAASQWGTWRNQLLAYVNNPPDFVLLPTREGTGISDLGAQYPAGTIWD